MSDAIRVMSDATCNVEKSLSNNTYGSFEHV